jgi:hypothetical protein
LTTKSKCKRLGNHSTKAERAEAHRVEMEMRRAKYELAAKELADDTPWVLANLSRDHEHFGDTPSEHEKRKNNS